MKFYKTDRVTRYVHTAGVFLLTFSISLFDISLILLIYSKTLRQNLFIIQIKRQLMLKNRQLYSIVFFFHYHFIS